MGSPIVVLSGIAISHRELKYCHATELKSVETHDPIRIVWTTHLGGWQAETPALGVMSVVVTTLNKWTDVLDTRRQLDRGYFIRASLISEESG